jgi:hypothetical protein
VIAVVHLVWGPLGTRSLREFLASYRRHPPGAEHELIVLLNNVPDPLPAEFQVALQGIEHRLLRTPEPVQDLAAYAHAAGCLEHERLPAAQPLPAGGSRAQRRA